MIQLARSQQIIPERGVVGLLGASLIVAAPLGLHLPLWISAAFVLCCVWRWLVAALQWSLPSTTLRLGLALIGIAAVFATHGTLLGRDAGVSFLILMISLKLLELKTLRDAHVVIVLDYFTILTGFLYSQSMGAAACMAMGILAVTAVLNNLNYEAGRQSLGWHLRVAANIGLQALPLMVVLFILFPRFAGPIWSVPGGHGGGTTGLSPDMAPGRISRLAQSDAVAFRVSFDGAAPPQDKLYWRGPVLWHTDGMRWDAGQPPDVFIDHRLHYVARGAPVRYSITLEPDDQHWLFALDLPASVPAIGYLTSDYELLSRRRVTERIHYSAASYLDYTTDRLTVADRRRALQLPARGNPRARALAQHWRATLHDDASVVRRALQFFHDQPFVYTMTPPPLSGDEVDDFLFHTRRGFCEHYSSSFTWLMRAAGIPARVVTGYQGGEVNPLGHYLIVRQSDAHAWSEVWLRGQGWVRIDPTAAVAPERIELGLEPISQPDGAPVLFEGEAPYPLVHVWNAMRLAWDALHYNWNQWVLGYGRQKQLQLLSHMGLPLRSLRALGLGLVLCVGVTFLIIAVYLLRPGDRRRDRIGHLYRRFCHKLERRGIRRQPHEGPLAFARRVAGLRPELAGQVRSICSLYAELRYGEAVPPGGLQRLRQRVRGFRP